MDYKMRISSKLMFELANDLDDIRPSVGKQVKVINKYTDCAGESGKVIAHLPDPNCRYAEDWRWLLMSLTGVEGHLVRIDMGFDKIWLKATDVRVIE
jgi:hypothetical protein